MTAARGQVSFKEAGRVDTQLLESFVVTAEELHFGRAARRLHVSQSTLSRQIGRLERDLHAQLFERGPRGVAMTPAGQRLLERGRPLLARVRELVAEVDRLGGATQVVRLGCPPYARGMGVISKLAERLSHRDPPLGLEIVYGLSGELTQRLLREELDASVLLLVADHEQLDVVELLEPRLQLLLPDSHRLARGDEVATDALHGESLILWPRETNPDLYDAILDTFPAGAFAEIVHLAASWDVIMSAVASAEGVSVVMPDLWQPQMTGVVNRPIAGDPRPGRLVIATRRGEHRPHVEAVVDELRGHGTRQ